MRKWHLVTYDEDDIECEALENYLDPKKALEHADDIIRQVGKIMGWVDMGWHETFTEAFREAYPNFKAESELRQKVLELSQTILVWFYKPRVDPYYLIRGKCIRCSYGSKTKRKRLVWKNNSTGMGFCKECYNECDKDDLLDMEVGQ